MVLEAVHKKPLSRTADVVEETQFPRTTIDRMLQELALQRMLEKSQGLRHDGTEGGRWQYCLADGIDPHAVTPEALSGKKYPETSEGGADTAREAVVVKEDINFPSMATEISGDFFAQELDLSSSGTPNVLDVPAPAAVHVLAPVQDIEADTCDDHLMAPAMVTRGCAVCQCLRGAAAA
jgi:hypothetical protein